MSFEVDTEALLDSSHVIGSVARALLTTHLSLALANLQWAMVGSVTDSHTFDSSCETALAGWVLNLSDSIEVAANNYTLADNAAQWAMDWSI